MASARTPRSAPGRSILRLRISIVDSDPLIHRLVELDAALTLAEVHDTIQLVFDWRDQHPHSFSDADPYAHAAGLPRIGRPPRVWGTADAVEPPEGDELDEAEYTLGEIFTGFDGPLFYQYDFGDCWVHAIELVERLEDADAPPALLVHAARRGPLEDSGGVAGYRDLLRALEDPEHPDRPGVVDWVRWTSGPWSVFDPDAVDVENVNLALAARFGAGRDGMDAGGTGADATGDADAASGTAESGTAETALTRLLARLPAPAARDLRGLLRRTGGFEPPVVDTATAAEMVGPYTWMLRTAADHGIRLTPAGRIPPAIVKRAMTEFGWVRPWHSTTFREDLIVPIARLHEDALQYGLLRETGGTLRPAEGAEALVDDPMGLWRHLARALVLRAPSDADRDIALLVAIELATGLADARRTRLGYDADGVGGAMGALGWGLDDGSPLPEPAVTGTVCDVLETLGTLGVLGGDRIEVLLHEAAGPVPGCGRAFARAVLATPAP